MRFRGFFKQAFRPAPARVPQVAVTGLRRAAVAATTGIAQRGFDFGAAMQRRLVPVARPALSRPERTFFRRALRLGGLGELGQAFTGQQLVEAQAKIAAEAAARERLAQTPAGVTIEAVQALIPSSVTGSLLD